MLNKQCFGEGAYQRGNSSHRSKLVERNRTNMLQINHKVRKIPERRQIVVPSLSRLQHMAFQFFPRVV